MIFIDANTPMYSAGAEHPLKAPSIEVLRLIQQSPSSFVTSAEVLQEIVHRYLAIRAWHQGRAVFERTARVMRGRIEPIYERDVRDAARLADSHAGVSARDLLHASVMIRLGIHQIVSTDRDFDSLPDIERLDPMLVDEWAHIVTETR